MAARTSGGADHGGGSVENSRGGGVDSRGGSMDSSVGGPLWPCYSGSPAHSAAAALARAVLASPAQHSHRWGSGFDGVDLDDDIWKIRFNFPGEDNLERTLSRSDITVLNLMALIEGHGYDMLDTMYYVRDKGKGFGGMEAVNSMAKVEQMLELFEEHRVLNLTVIRKNASIPDGLNKDDLLAEFPGIEPSIFSVDTDGVTYISEEEIYPVAIDYSEVLFVGTQQSCNLDKGKEVVLYDDVPDDVIDTDDEIFGAVNMGQYIPEDHSTAVEAELELIRKLKREREEETPEDVYIQEKLSQQKKHRLDPEMHIEGDTDVEEVYEDEEDSEAEEVPEDDFFIAKKNVAKLGPTSRTHHEVEQHDLANFVPSDEEV